MTGKGTWSGRVCVAAASYLLGTSALAVDIEDVRPMDEVPSECMECHSAEEAFMGAATVGDTEAWQHLLETRGFAALVENTIDGRGAMPPRGATELDDDEIAAAILTILRDSDIDIDDLPE